MNRTIRKLYDLPQYNVELRSLGPGYDWKVQRKLTSWAGEYVCVPELTVAIREAEKEVDRLKWMVLHGFWVKQMADTGLWMVLDNTGYPATGAEHDSVDEAIDDFWAEMGKVVNGQG